MSGIVTIGTLGEAGQHACRMRRTMAALAGWHHLVLVFMAGNTINSFMLGIGFAVQLEGLLVT